MPTKRIIMGSLLSEEYKKYTIYFQIKIQFAKTKLKISCSPYIFNIN